MGCDGMETALIYATTFLTKGNAEIAKYISRNAGTDIFNLKDLMRLNLDRYGAIVFGTANNGGKPDKLIQEFVENNKDVLAKKKLYLYVLCAKDDEKTMEQVAQIAEQLGIPEAVGFPKKAEEMNESGYPVVVDDFIAKL